MSNMSIATEVRPTFSTVSAKFDNAEKALINAMYTELNSQGPVLSRMMRTKIRAKVGRQSVLEDAIERKTHKGSHSARLTVSAPAHAKPHRIYAKTASALVFSWPRLGVTAVVPKRGGFRTHRRGDVLMVGKGYVDHPGGSLVPLMSPIVTATGNEWLAARGGRVLMKLPSHYIQELIK